jgi:hypothetical protein
VQHVCSTPILQRRSALIPAPQNRCAAFGIDRWDEILSRTESTHGPSQEMTERGDDDQNHGPNLTQTRGVRSVSNSFILRLHGVLTRDSLCDS